MPAAKADDRSQLDPVLRDFAMCFSSTPRGARLARRLVAVRLDAWGMAYGSEVHDAMVLIVAELSANAIRHGRVPGRDFRLRLVAGAEIVRVEVTDTRSESLPVVPPGLPTDLESDGGRGLVLVAGLAARWGWTPRPGAPGKTVWAECCKP
ncbi:ATP-binding protein [Streptomyces sp. YIM 130001]|uniref:ATP-binding protein n=1 Tax=Streptomyces sp. YIM 130001 TaxID=2259644 RepID=UPI001F092867|nr:ATP-binding protein [Streptomyces sp. YIM 130001]